MKVIFSELAIADFKEIAGYLIENAGADVAYAVTDEIERVVHTVIVNNPEIGTAVPTIDGVRFFPAGKYPIYGIYYEVLEDMIFIYRVVHGKRDVENIL